MSTPADDAAQDARDLRRGATVNMIGYALKIAHPVLLAIVTQLYGAERFGVFVVAQAAITVTARACTLGLESGVAWWVARQDPERERSGVLGALIVVTVTSLLAALAIALGPRELIAAWAGDADAGRSIQWMAAALPFFVVSEVLLFATMGKRRMEPQVIVRETAVPVVMFGSAAALYAGGFSSSGLAIAFFASQLIGLVGAWLFFARVFRESRFIDASVPPDLARFAAPVWVSHITNSTLQRVDLLIVGALTSPATVGVYAIVVQFANAVRAIRRSFDPIVSAIVARLSVRPDRARLSDGYSYASVLVTITQVPVLVTLACLGPWLLPLYGDGFDAGTGALLIHAAFWAVLSPVGLAGIVVLAHGRSGLTLLNVVVTLALASALIWLLTPIWGIEGAALGTGIAYAAQHALQLFQMRAITGSYNYTRAVLAPFTVTFASLIACGIAWIALLPLGDSTARVGALAAFLVCFGPVMFVLGRTGRLTIARVS